MFPRLGNSVISLRSRVARTSSVLPQAECIEMETTSKQYHSASRVARTSSVPPQAECIEMETTTKQYHSASRYYLSRASPNHSMTLCKPEHPQPKKSCKDIECSAAGGMYRDGNHINPLSNRISILFGSCLTKSFDDPLQTRTPTTQKQLQGHRVFRRRRNVSRWKPYQTTITAHLDTIWLVPHQITR